MHTSKSIGSYFSGSGDNDLSFVHRIHASMGHQSTQVTGGGSNSLVDPYLLVIIVVTGAVMRS
jgi:hypothetical protein